MRLLEIKDEGEYGMTEFYGSNIPPYAILSHTWGPSEQEFNFRDFADGTGKDKAGYAKIEFCGRQTAIDGLQYFWVDTCCIDKSSSAELTESINSMFQWYKRSAKCYAYLSDVTTDGRGQDDRLWLPAFLQSRWFSRGWTLQELIAPTSVEFFSQDNQRLGDKKSLENEVANITGIDVLALRGLPLSSFTVAQRMSWAAKRESTREEDNAYCLFGIFDVYMPLIYGEGKRAFTRLKEEVNKHSYGALDTSPKSSPNETEGAIAWKCQKPNRADIVQWLKYHDPYTNHVAAQRKKQAHTGSWFFSGKQCVGWQRGLIPFLWISGSAGSGKTVLCSTIIETLLQDSSKDVSSKIAYYYFDFSEAETRSLDSFIRSLIIQLTNNLSEVPQDLLHLHARSQDNKQAPSTESLKGVLRGLLMKIFKPIIVVDALDECLQPEELVQLIGEMKSWNSAGLQLLVVSRQHFEATENLEDLQPVHISIQDEATNNDISTFVQGILDKDPKLRRWPLQIKKDIETALVSRSSGMFRWVACQTDILRKCRTQRDVDIALRTLPRTLEETYDRILGAISDDCKSDVREVLQWLAFSERPLRLEEVAEIVAFDTTHTFFDVNKRLLNPLDVLTMCSSLLVANETYCYDNYSHTRVPITELRLAHFTVKDYIMSKSLQQSQYSYYSIDSKSSNLQIAKACLTYLNMEEFSSGYMGRKVQDERLREWPLLSYAANFSGLHLGFCENELDITTRSLLQKLLATHTLPNGGNFGSLVGIKWHTAPHELIRTTKPLYFAASSGLVSIVQLLLADVAAIDIEAKGGRYGSSSLQVASYKGYTDCVRMLLAAGADPNSTNNLNETSMYWAKVYGLDEIVDLLLSYGAIR